MGKNWFGNEAIAARLAEENYVTVFTSQKFSSHLIDRFSFY